MAKSLVGRARRKRRIRKKISGTQERPRLTVYRSHQHIYAQVIDDDKGHTLATMTSLGKEKPVIQEVQVDTKDEKDKEKQDKSKGKQEKSQSKQNKSKGKQQKLTSKLAMAAVVGQDIATVCREMGIEKVVFDRNGYLYHGRVKALAEAARKAGLVF